MVDVDTIGYKDCYVAFLDILGFSEKVADSQSNQETLKILIDSLSICGIFPSGGKKEVDSQGPRTISVKSRFFSDSIVFIMQKKPEDVSQLFFMTRYLQDRLWEKSICLRGAITLGSMYWDDSDVSNITVGPALIEAHKLESEIAIYPRIIVSEELYAYIDSCNMRADPFGGGLNSSHNPQALLKDYIKRDADGVYFLDLLNSEILRTNDEKLELFKDKFSITWNILSESNHDHIITKIDGIIVQGLGSDDKKIKQKYEWMKNYRNNIVD